MTVRFFPRHFTASLSSLCALCFTHCIFLPVLPFSYLLWTSNYLFRSSFHCFTLVSPVSASLDRSTHAQESQVLVIFRGRGRGSTLFSCQRGTLPWLRHPSQRGASKTDLPSPPPHPAVRAPITHGVLSPLMNKGNCSILLNVHGLWMHSRNE